MKSELQNCGGPAFPCHVTYTDEGLQGVQLGVRSGIATGLSIRDWLAPKAPEAWVKERVSLLRKIDHQKMLADKSCTYQEKDEIHLIAAAQYQYADAMLKARTA